MEMHKISIAPDTVIYNFNGRCRRDIGAAARSISKDINTISRNPAMISCGMEYITSKKYHRLYITLKGNNVRKVIERLGDPIIKRIVFKRLELR